MKKFIEEYGFAILAAIVVIMLIVISTPVSSVIKNRTMMVIDSFGERTDRRLSEFDSDAIQISVAESEPGTATVTILSISSKTDKYKIRFNVNNGGWEDWRDFTLQTGEDGYKGAYASSTGKAKQTIEFEIKDQGTDKTVKTGKIKLKGTGSGNSMAGPRIISIEENEYLSPSINESLFIATIEGLSLTAAHDSLRDGFSSTIAEGYVIYHDSGNFEEGETVYYGLSLGVQPVEVTSVSISGTAGVGETLTATVSPAEATGSYQWYRGDSPISGATGSTYTLTSDDHGQTIKCSFIGSGSYQGNVMSDSTAIVKEWQKVTRTIHINTTTSSNTYNFTNPIRNPKISCRIVALYQGNDQYANTNTHTTYFTIGYSGNYSKSNQWTYTGTAQATTTKTETYNVSYQFNDNVERTSINIRPYASVYGSFGRYRTQINSSDIWVTEYEEFK